MTGHNIVIFLFGFAMATVCWVMALIHIVTRRQGRDPYEDHYEEELGI